MLLPVPESMYPWVMMILMALLLAPVEFASPCSHSGRYHRVRFPTQLRLTPPLVSTQPPCGRRLSALQLVSFFAELLIRRRADMLKAEPARVQRAEIGCSMRVYDFSYS